MKGNLPEKAARELLRCQQDRAYFVLKYLKVEALVPTGKVDQYGAPVERIDLVPLEPKPVQVRLHHALKRRNDITVLKARKEGVTTWVGAEFFHGVMFYPRNHALIVAHHGEATRGILRIYRTFWESLPRWMRDVFPLARSPLDCIWFEHGSMINTTTAESQKARQATYRYLHASEIAHWADTPKTMAAIGASLVNDAVVVRETTANGMNDFARFWNEDRESEHLFFSWLDDPTYVRDTPPVGGFDEAERAYIDAWRLPPERANWFAHRKRTKLANNMSLWNQEYPVTPEVAFVSTGDRFFPCVFPNANPQDGYIQWAEPNEFRLYTLGADTATGSSDGDFSAFVVLDVTDKKLKRAYPVASFYGKPSITDWCKLCLAEAKKYNALAVVETNGYGTAVVDYMKSEFYAHMYRQSRADSATGQLLDTVGWYTSRTSRPQMLHRLHEWVTFNWLPPVDERLQKEINSFKFNAAGIPTAAPTCHDDMIVAHALALMGMDQVHHVEQAIYHRRPETIREILEWETAYNRAYDPDEQGLYDRRYEPFFEGLP